MAVRLPARARGRWGELAVISAGGMAGAVGRYAVSLALPPHRDGFPWATFAVNVSGCLLVGVVMALITEVWSAHRLVRLFLGVGVLGGYTTFSTYTVEASHLIGAGAPRTALLYLGGTLVAALVAVYVGIGLTRLVGRVHAPREERS